MTRPSSRFAFLLAALIAGTGLAPQAVQAEPVVLPTKLAAVATETAIAARSPEVLRSYDQAPQFTTAIAQLEPALRQRCVALLESQLRLQKETDSWKMYSLYEMLASENLMTAPLVRVLTVTQLSESLPQYTNYRASTDLQDGALLIADKGPQCGPDPLSKRKGAYFLKCGSFLIGSGLVRAKNLNLKTCENIRILILGEKKDAAASG